MSLSDLISAQPPGHAGRASHKPGTWVEWGAYYEDMEDPVVGVEQLTPRCQDHFYSVTQSRIPGQVTGLTDTEESNLLPSGNNSFAWAAVKGTAPVWFAHNLNQSWQDARIYELTALTDPTKSVRDENLALMFDALGHVLHLNQDLSQPDHVRNDNHFSKRYIEECGAPQKSDQWLS